MEIHFFPCLFYLQALDVLTQELTAHLDGEVQELRELEKEKVSFDQQSIRGVITLTNAV